jgi:ABC-type branched-subunit amino acid transport system ATPase component
VIVLFQVVKIRVGTLSCGEQQMLAIEVCYRGYLFAIGTIAFERANESLLKDEKIQKVFLGDGKY